MKIFLSIVVVLIVLVGGFFAFNSYIYNEKQGDGDEQGAGVADYKNAEYMVEGDRVQLINGVSEVAVPDSSAKIVTQYFGNEVHKDLNGDGKEDVAFLLTQNGGGTGTFFYVVAALNTSTGYIGSDGYLLGDRIAPQTTESGPGTQIIVNYAVRKEGDPFTAAPSVGKSAYLLLDPATLKWGIVDHEFTGDSDMIHVTSPKNGATIGSPVTITGEARGTWYFEASFPIDVVDGSGKLIGQGHADAKGDWMTTEFVPFTASITFDPKKIVGTSRAGKIILRNDNPSGLPQNEKSIAVPVVFK